jgi:SAM-dependent methyltransferase
MVNKEDVIAAYRLFLGREPENEAVVSFHSEQAISIDDLRTQFIQCVEFQSTTAISLAQKPLDWPPIEVEVDASASQLAMMMTHIESNWHHLGQTEPHWSVVTSEEFLASNIIRTKDRFYQSGKFDAERLQRTAQRCGIILSEFNCCFELGCGVGRATLWLADLFDRIVATDISKAHLELAQKVLDSSRITNVQLNRLESFSDIDALPEFDVFFTFIVLQHNPPPLIAALLNKILSKLKVGGIAYFQVPTYRLGYRFRVDEYLRHASPSGGMEMHLIPQQVLFRILRQNGCRVLEFREDNFTFEPGCISNSIFVRKLDAPCEAQPHGGV